MLGCGRSAEFGTVDMARIENEAPQLVVLREEATKQLTEIQKEFEQALAGKSGKDREEVVREFQARANIVRSNLANRMKNQVDGVIHQVAQEKGLGAVLLKEAVPDGGKDITEVVLEKLK